MNSISLFSGAGGMDIGFKQAGFQTIAANELDSHACQTLRLNNPNLNVFEGDIKRYIQDLSNFKNIEVIFGGPPCQGFSIAGKMDHDDPRSQPLERHWQNSSNWASSMTC